MAGRTKLPAHISLISSGETKKPGPIVTDENGNELDIQNHDDPKRKTTLPEPPKHLSAASVPYWEHYGNALLKLGVFTQPDSQALAMLCNLTEEYWRADERERNLPQTVENNVRWTAISHKRSVEKQLKTMLDAFGLTPAARVKVRG